LARLGVAKGETSASWDAKGLWAFWNSKMSTFLGRAVPRILSRLSKGCRIYQRHGVAEQIRLARELATALPECFMSGIRRNAWAAVNACAFAPLQSISCSASPLFIEEPILDGGHE
jgi:hypothetical protein